MSIINICIAVKESELEIDLRYIYMLKIHSIRLLQKKTDG